MSKKKISRVAKLQVRAGEASPAVSARTSARWA